ncbi:MAG: DUF1015 domain-containing protein [Deltaproteobacteria bacterium]|nr:DUF1015 domain-containing protein [Deltaproteobacteria bacterium]
MADVRPFPALRPRDDLAGDVIAPPYDVLTEAEARDLAKNKRSFVQVTRPEATMRKGTDPHSDAAYQRARKNLDALVETGALQQDEAPTYYFYGQRMGQHHQVGVIAAASVEEYDRGQIRKHEHTRPDKEDDRTHHMEVLDVQVGLVFLTYRATNTLRALTAKVTALEPAWRVTTEDEVEHTLWPAPPDMIDRIRAGFARAETLYIADGHHRSAAASRVHANRQDEQSATFLAGLYPDDQLQVLAYNRVVKDLHGHEPEAFLDLVQTFFTVLPHSEPQPPERGSFTMYFQGDWHLLSPRPGLFDEADPVARLDVSVLQDHLLAPILGIEDPRTSDRIAFVGGLRGHQALRRAVDEEGAAVAFHLYPTGLDQLFEVADAGLVMPPKSTWFEPKLREGVAIRSLK